MTSWNIRFMALSCACQAPDVPCPTPAPEADPVALVASTPTDTFDGGSLSVLDLSSGQVCDHVTLATGDTVVSRVGSYIAQIDRLRYDRIRLFEPGAWTTPVAEFSTGPGSNPHAVVPCGEDLLVSLYELDELVRFDLQGRRVRSYDLAPYADRDGIPEASSLIRRGDRVWVGLQRLDRNDGFEPASRGLLHPIDCAGGDAGPTREGPTDIRLADHPDGVVMYGSTGEVLLVPDSGEARALANLEDEVSLAAFGPAGDGLLIVQPRDLWYRIECLRADGLRSTLLATDAYLPDVQVVGDVAWVAVRNGWANPDDRPSTVPVIANPAPGLWAIDLTACALQSEDPVPFELGPFSLAPY